VYRSAGRYHRRGRASFMKVYLVPSMNLEPPLRPVHPRTAHHLDRARRSTGFPSRARLVPAGVRAVPRVNRLRTGGVMKITPMTHRRVAIPMSGGMGRACRDFSRMTHLTSRPCAFYHDQGPLGPPDRPGVPGYRSNRTLGPGPSGPVIRRFPRTSTVPLRPGVRRSSRAPDLDTRTQGMHRAPVTARGRATSWP